jgi:hypothetical protein
MPDFSGLSARDTVDAWTPARSATSRKVILCLPARISVNQDLGDLSYQGCYVPIAFTLLVDILRPFCNRLRILLAIGASSSIPGQSLDKLTSRRKRATALHTGKNKDGTLKDGEYRSQETQNWLGWGGPHGVFHGVPVVKGGL